MVTCVTSPVAFPLARYEQDIAFERYVLDKLTPLIARKGNLDVIDLRQPGLASTTGYVGFYNKQTRATSFDDVDATVDVRPLVFGAAWKTLDLLIELALPPKSSGEWHDFAGKCSQARNNGIPKVRPFRQEPDIWRRLMHLYASTEAVRHSLVHRKINVDPSSGEITATPDPGQSPLLPLTVEDQEAFCRIAQGVATAVTNDQLTSRQRSQLCFFLDQLQIHHGLSSMNGTKIDGLIPRVLALGRLLSSGKVGFNPPGLISAALQVRPEAVGIDLALEVPGIGEFVGELDDAPVDQAYEFNPASPPRWLRPA